MFDKLKWYWKELKDDIYYYYQFKKNTKDLKKELVTLGWVTDFQQDWASRIHIVISMPQSYYDYLNEFSSDQSLSLKESVVIEKRKHLIQLFKKHRMSDASLTEIIPLNSGSVVFIYAYSRLNIKTLIKTGIFSLISLTLLLTYLFYEL
jgi:hypothetical protein